MRGDEEERTTAGRRRLAAPVRPRFSDRDVAEIRRSRRQPRRTDHLFLHLRALLRGLEEALADVRAEDVLDVYCGARPYDDLLPRGARCVGFDIDDAFGVADVVSPEVLPFEDASFDLVLCTQAFYFLPHPEEAVREFARVLRADGTIVLTSPVAYPGTERLYTETQLRELFAGWRGITVVANGGTAVSRATLSGYILRQIEKRLSGPTRLLRGAFPLSYLLINAVGSMLDSVERRLLPDAETLPTNLLLKAKRPAAGTKDR